MNDTVVKRSSSRRAPLRHPHKRFVSVGLWIGVWTILGLFFTTQTFVYNSYSRNPLGWGQSLALSMTQWYLWGLAAPAVHFLARRFPFGRRQWLRAVSIHLPVAIGVAALKLALDVTMAQAVLKVPGSAVPVVQLHLNVLTYLVIVGASQAADAFKKARERELRASKAEARLAEARLDVLRMQLQPHFLFNTLHAISTLVHEDPEAADRMIARLSELLRLSLEASGVNEVSLKQELEFLRRYIEIEETRFQDRLTIRMDVSPDTLDARVPNLILQPLVENAIRHGVARRAGPGMVEIRATREGDQLRLAITDDGPGLPDKSSRGARRGAGLGLANTRDRLVQLYGKHHRFRLENAPTGGLRVTLELPFRTMSNTRTGESD